MQTNLDLRDKKKEQRREPSEKLLNLQVIPGQPNKVVKIEAELERQVLIELDALLLASGNVFAWSHEDMPVNDRKVMEHRLNVDPKVRPVCQKKIFFDANRNAILAQKIDKLLKASFIRE